MAPKPRKNPDITIRLSPEEREVIDRAAEADHLSSSTWLRRIALFGAEDPSSRQAERQRVADLAARVRGGEAPSAAKAGRRGPRGKKR
jgi:hypothetical protein